MPVKATTIDEFLARLGAEQRAALEQLRRDIHAAASGLEEVISYGVPGFRLGGRLLVWIGAGANHCAFYPGALPIARHARELARYQTSKGTIRFAPSKPLPSSLVATLVRTRVAESAARTPAGKTRQAASTSTKPAAKRRPASTGRGSGAKRGATKRGTTKRTATKRAATKRATSKRSVAKRGGAKRPPRRRG